MQTHELKENSSNSQCPFSTSPPFFFSSSLLHLYSGEEISKNMRKNQEVELREYIERAVLLTLSRWVDIHEIIYVYSFIYHSKKRYSISNLIFFLLKFNYKGEAVMPNNSSF